MQVSIRSISIMLMMIGFLVAQEQQLSLAYDDLPRLLEESSQHFKMLNAREDLTHAESDIELQWSNPELNYEFEQVENRGVDETEQVVSLNKSISMPWNYWQERKIWQSEISAAGLNRKQNVNQLLADARIGYVKMGLLKNLTQQLLNLTEVFDSVQKTIQARREEGAVSQLDAALLSISLFGLEADIIETQQEYHQSMSNWKKILGLNETQKINLMDSIEFKNTLINLPQRQNLLEAHLGLQARYTHLNAMDRRVSLEKGRILPSFSLQGGYKKVNTDWEGFVLGISLPLPLLNWNGSQIEKQKIERLMYATETSLYKQNLQSEIENLTMNIHAKAELFQKHKYVSKKEKIVENLEVAYSEGTLSLTDFLNALQLYREGSRNYVDQLIAYYQAVFELEALSGQQLVTF